MSTFSQASWAVGIVLLVGFVILGIFYIPIWIIYVARGLFGIDWSQKYWLVFQLVLIIGLLTNSGSGRK